jgi:DNA-directed RNA polymerase specialized sigma24 family protein
VEFIDEEYNQEQDRQDSERIESIKQKMTKLEWYEGVIFQIHLEGVPMKKISRDTKIPYNSVRATIKNVKNKLK